MGVVRGGSVIQRNRRAFTSSLLRSSRHKHRVENVTKGAIRKLKLKAGIPRIDDKGKELTKRVYVAILDELLYKAVLHRDSRSRLVLEKSDVVEAAKFMDMNIYI